MGKQMLTSGGYSMYDMSSLLQKAIRRGRLKEAAFAARELYDTYFKYVWKRLLVISAEDCYGIMTKEIIALKAADDVVNEGRKAGDKDTIFISKAVTLLCMARKNRDACYVACNLFIPSNTCPDEVIPHVSDLYALTLDEIPDWTYDCHTIKGRLNGKDDLDMVDSEQRCLFPLQPSIFDDGDWQEDSVDTGYAAKNPSKLAAFQENKKTTDECIDGYFGAA